MLGSHPPGGTDALTLSEVSPEPRPVCASFLESVPEDPASSPATCSSARPASHVAIECFQEQMLAFQSAMQRQMEAITSFVISSQPLVVPVIPADPLPAPASSVEPPTPPVAQEVVVTSAAAVVTSQPSPLLPAPGMQLDEISPVPSLLPSVLVSSRDDFSVVKEEPLRRDLFESSALEGFSLHSIWINLGTPPVGCPTFSEGGASVAFPPHWFH